jgi:hypothetical protein
LAAIFPNSKGEAPDLSRNTIGLNAGCVVPQFEQKQTEGTEKKKSRAQTRRRFAVARQEAEIGNPKL